MNEEQMLIEKAQLGDKTALSQLLQMHLLFIKKYVLKITCNLDTTDDLVQETMIKAILSIKSYQPKTKFSSWLITIATRTYIDQLRKRKRELNYLDIEQMRYRHLNWQFVSENEERAAEAMDRLSKLADDVRMMIVLKYLYDYRYSEIAVLLHIPEGTVKSKIFYGLQKLREEHKETDGKE